MARKVHSKLETRAARLRLTIRPKPHEFTTIGPGIALGYRRNVGAGTWVLRVADRKGGNWTKAVGFADDFTDAGGDVLTWWQAVAKGLKLVRGEDDAAGRPATVAEAVEAYKKDLAAHKHDTDNATRISKHLPPSLAAKIVAMLTELDLSTWRDDLLDGGMKHATFVRIARAFKAALNLAQRRDKRVRNADAWRHGLGGIQERAGSRNVFRLDDTQVRAVIRAAHEIDANFGLLIEVLAVTGARISQAAALVVADLVEDHEPRLMMPPSKKGSRRGKVKTAEPQPLPISPSLAARLRSNRPDDAPLLLRSDGKPWQSSRNDDHMGLYAAAAKAAGVKGSVTALRHSVIIRLLLARTPTKLVASLTDTSTAMIEQTYGKYIATFGADIVRGALLDVE